MGFEIGLSDEFFEVLNAFPVLRSRLEELNFDLSGVKEGESFGDFYLRKGFSADELDFFLKRINSDVKFFLKKGRFPEVSLKDENEVLVLGEE